MSNYTTNEYQQVDHDNTSWQKIMGYVDPKTTILDIGCSSGNFGAELIDQKKCVVDGFELDLDDVELAKKQLRQVMVLNIEDGTPEGLDGQYDYVAYIDVIEHLVNPVQALKNTKPLLKADGKILFSIPNMSHISVRMAALRGEFGYGETGILDKTHLHFYDFKEIERVFHQAGYKFVQIDYTMLDIPDATLTDQLTAMGLTGSQKFYDDARRIENVAYQICGVATPLAKREKVKTMDLPAIYPLADEMDRQVKKLQQLHVEDIDRVKAHYERLLGGMDEQDLLEYRDMKGSKFYKLWKRYRKLRDAKPDKQS